MYRTQSTKRARSTVTLSQLSPGTKFRLFAKYKDGSPRPRFKWNDVYLNSHELEVIEHMPGVTRVRAAGKDIPLWPGIRVAS